MSSRSAAKKITKPLPRAKASPAPKAGKAKLARVTKLPAPKPAPKQAPAAAKKTVPPPSQPPKKPGTQPHPPAHGHPHAQSPRTPPGGQPARQQSLARSFYWSELRVGDDLPPLTKPAIDRVQIVRFSAAAGDFNRLHVDEPFAQAAGFPGLFAPGMLAMAFVGQLLSSWLRRGHVRKVSARFIKLVWPGDELTCRGRIAELRREAGACYADVELWAENQKGELVLRGQAACELYESPAAGGSDGGGLLFALQQSSLPAPSAMPSRKLEPSRAKTPPRKR